MRLRAFFAAMLLSASAMAQQAVNTLPRATTVAGTDLTIDDQAGTTRVAAFSDVSNYVLSQLTNGTVIGLWAGSCSSTTFLRGDGLCISGGAGTGTVDSGIANQLTYYPSSTSEVAGAADTSITGGALTLGLANTAMGSVILEGSTSGAVSIRPQAAAGTYNFNLPTTAGSSGNILASGGGGSAAETWDTTTGSGTVVALATSPTFVTPTLGAATATSVNGVTIPSASDTVDLLGTAQTFTAVKKFTNSDFCLLGSSTGCTTFASANAGASNFTLTFPAATDTVATIAATQTLTNKSIAGSEINSGLVGATVGGTGVNNGASTLTYAQSSTFTSSTGNIGTLEVLQNAQSVSYTLVLSDSGKHIYHTSGSAHTFTIPANGTVAFPVGTSVTFVNESGGGAVTIAITTDTMYLSPAGTTGSRTLAAFGVATALKIDSTHWIISGSGLT